MNNRTLLILIYTLVVLAVIISVKLVQAHASEHQETPQRLIADCNDGPLPTPGSE